MLYEHKLQRIIVGTAKGVCVVLILVWLFWQASQGDTFAKLYESPKHWGLLALGVVATFIGVSITIFRWLFLVRTIGIPLSVGDAWRVGMISFVFNLSPMGIAGGDLIRTYLLSSKLKQSGSRSFASVVIDRIIGLYVMFLFSTILVLATGFWRNTQPIAKIATFSVFVCLAASTLGIAALFFVSSFKLSRLITKLQPKPIEKFVSAIGIYRNRVPSLLFAMAMTFVVHFIFCLSVYLLAHGLFRDAPTLLDHCILHPIANITSIIPLPAGPYEAVLDKMYPLFPFTNGEYPQRGFGLIVALSFRFANLIIAVIGVVYYIRKSVS